LKIVKHKLTEDKDLAFKQTPNVGKNFPKGLPDTIIIHFTGAPSANAAINWLTNKTAGASAHLVIAKDGKITQLADFNLITWHAGRSKWKDREGLNNYSIGIELDNCGILTKVNSNTYRFGEKGPTFSKDEVILAKHKNGDKVEAWQKDSELQLERTKEVCKLLIEEYGIKLILGHDEIAPGRKADPGPAFPMEELRNLLLNQSTKKEEIYSLPQKGVSVKELVLYKTPNIDDKIIHKKINSNTEVTILEEKNNFFKISVPILGYISKAHVSLDNTDSPKDGVVQTDGLNFRSKPDPKSETLGESLKKGTSFLLLENGAGWIFVRVEREGWVEKSGIRFL
jgi:N-acetylmuramoyl-L-alanine amidase